MTRCRVNSTVQESSYHSTYKSKYRYINDKGHILDMMILIVIFSKPRLCIASLPNGESPLSKCSAQFQQFSI